MYYLSLEGNELCRAISEIIYDYKQGQIPTCDLGHVHRWASQFDYADQEVILKETKHILEQCYFSKEDFKQYIDVVFNHYSLQFWKDVRLLNIQINGNSQHDLNDLLLQKHHYVGSEDNFNPSNFVYLDDFIFSGNRLLTDLTDWIINGSPNYPITIYVILIGHYEYGHYFVGKKLREIADTHSKKITFEFISSDEFKYENRFYKKDFSQVCWPTSSVLQNAAASNYFNTICPQFSFRVHLNADIVPFNTNRREAFENALVKYGLRIMSFSVNNSSVMKPLGFSTFKNFGFGSMVFTYRNCPNNNPLIFWWGDPSKPLTHPFSKWYPLLPRSTYGGV